MVDPSSRPRRIRFLRTGWRLASAQVASVLALLLLLLLGSAALVFPSPTVRTLAVVLPLLLLLLAGFLFATCRYLVADLEAGALRQPDGEVVELSTFRAVVAIGQSGNAVTGSGRPYQYVVWSLGALTDAAGQDVLDLVAEVGRGEALPQDGGFGFLIEATTEGFVPLVDAATEKRVTNLGEKLASALAIPFVLLPPDPHPAPLRRSGALGSPPNEGDRGYLA